MNKLVKAAASFVLTAFFIAILCFALYTLTDIFDSKLFVPSLIFQVISYVVLIILSAIGSKLGEKIGTPMLIALAVLSFLYVLITYIVAAVTYLFVSINVYVLINLVVAFIYFGISTVIVLTGISHIKSLSSGRKS